MGQGLLQILAIALLLAGECGAVWAEVSFACDRAAHGLTRSIVVHAGAMAAASVGLLGGYRLCTRVLGDVWAVGVLSIVTILIAEPAITLLVSGQRPGPGAVVGLLLGGLGLLIALLWR